MKIDWPTIEHPVVFHLGSMNRSDKGRTHNANSLEGAGLSVSIHPQAWRQIARLGGQPGWSLQAGQGGAVRFLDAHALNADHLAQMHEWGVGAGLVRPTELAVLSYQVDDECGESTRSVILDLLCNGAAGRDAEWARAERMLEELLDGSDATLELAPGFAATELLALKSGYERAVPPVLVKDLLLAAYSEDVLAAQLSVHGVWWSDELNVGSLSAPRGVVHPAALPSLSVSAIEDKDLPAASWACDGDEDFDDLDDLYGAGDFGGSALAA